MDDLVVADVDAYVGETAEEAEVTWLEVTFGDGDTCFVLGVDVVFEGDAEFSVDIFGETDTVEAFYGGAVVFVGGA